MSISLSACCRTNLRWNRRFGAANFLDSCIAIIARRWTNAHNNLCLSGERSSQYSHIRVRFIIIQHYDFRCTHTNAHRTGIAVHAFDKCLGRFEISTRMKHNPFVQVDHLQQLTAGRVFTEIGIYTSSHRTICEHNLFLRQLTCMYR